QSVRNHISNEYKSGAGRKCFYFQAADGIRDRNVTGVQTCALPISLVVVEHDEDTMRAADWIVDIGPGAGVHGGEVVAQGTVEDRSEERRVGKEGRVRKAV